MIVFLAGLCLFLFGLVALGLLATWLDGITERRDSYRRNHR